MARGRMVSTTVAIDRRLNALSVEAHLLFLMTVPHLDRDGLIAGDATLIAGRVLPRRPEMHPRIEALIGEWVAAELVIAYETPDATVLYFPGFRKNQTFQYAREGVSQFPPPPGYHRSASGLVQEEVCEPVDEVKSNSRPTPEKVPTKLKEVKLKEEKLSQAATPPLPDLPIVTAPAPGSNGAGKKQAEQMQALNAKLGPELRRHLADHLLKITGTYDLAKTEAGNGVLYEAHQAAVAIHAMNYKTPEDLLPPEDDWYANDFRGQKRQRPTMKQFVEHASKFKAGAPRPDTFQPTEVYG